MFLETRADVNYLSLARARLFLKLAGSSTDIHPLGSAVRFLIQKGADS